jgi:hypothetical protein
MVPLAAMSTITSIPFDCPPPFFFYIASRLIVYPVLAFVAKAITFINHAGAALPASAYFPHRPAFRIGALGQILFNSLPFSSYS